jgi:DNA-binding NtrC family response regulator
MRVRGGQSALDILRQDGADYDLVFSDVVMPGISGIDLARQIAAEWSDLEVVLTSGCSHVLVEEGSFGLELLKKPYSIDRLLRALRQDRPT